MCICAFCSHDYHRSSGERYGIIMVLFYFFFCLFFLKSRPNKSICKNFQGSVLVCVYCHLNSVMLVISLIVPLFNFHISYWKCQNTMEFCKGHHHLVFNVGEVLKFVAISFLKKRKKGTCKFRNSPMMIKWRNESNLKDEFSVVSTDPRKLCLSSFSQRLILCDPTT